MTTTGAPARIHAASSPIVSAAGPVEPADSPDLVDRVAEAMRSHGIEAIVVATGAEAREAVLARVPEGAEVHSGKSKTIEDLGLFAELMESGRYDAIRPKLQKMDRATQGREMRKLGAAPDFELGSVAAVTEDGKLVAASATGNQLAAYAGGAGKVILVVGAQKIVKDLDAALARIDDVVFPYEDARVQQMLGVGTKLAKVLVIYGEWIKDRTTVILVREPIGV
ncbi:MAG TPA: LUD domain-containing protein [Candidatus Binatus sp.]|nr:LUD domain-containing protein [Candidatus Binatus sp.]